eukprot:s726_g4.t1
MGLAVAFIGQEMPEHQQLSHLLHLSEKWQLRLLEARNCRAAISGRNFALRPPSLGPDVPGGATASKRHLLALLQGVETPRLKLEGTAGYLDEFPAAYLRPAFIGCVARIFHVCAGRSASATLTAFRSSCQAACALLMLLGYVRMLCIRMGCYRWWAEYCPDTDASNGLREKVQKALDLLSSRVGVGLLMASLLQVGFTVLANELAVNWTGPWIAEGHGARMAETLKLYPFSLIDVLLILSIRLQLAVFLLAVCLEPPWAGLGLDGGSLHFSSSNLRRQLICAFEPQQLEQLASSQGDSVRVLKQHLAELCGESRYKVRLVTQGRVLQDQDLLSELRPPLDLQMLRQDYVAPTPMERENLFKSAENGDVAMLDEILSLGFAGSKPVDPNALPEPTEPPHWIHFMDRSALQLASAGGHRDCVRMLIDAKACVAMANSGGDPALFEASRLGHWEIVMLLVEANADVDENALSGKTPIQAACENGHTDAVQVLLKANAKKPALKFGCSNRQILRLLLNAGVDRSQESMSEALWHAVRGGKADVLQVLLESGANPNVMNKDGISPLWYAADVGLPGYVAHVLLEAGADKDWVDEQGTSPLWIAADHGHLQMVTSLVKAGADYNKVNKRGVSPLQIAKYRDHPDVVEFLLRPERDMRRRQLFLSKVWCRRSEVPQLTDSRNQLGLISRQQHRNKSHKMCYNVLRHVKLRRQILALPRSVLFGHGNTEVPESYCGPDLNDLKRMGRTSLVYAMYFPGIVFWHFFYASWILVLMFSFTCGCLVIVSQPAEVRRLFTQRCLLNQHGEGVQIRCLCLFSWYEVMLFLLSFAVGPTAALWDYFKGFLCTDLQRNCDRWDSKAEPSLLDHSYESKSVCFRRTAAFWLLFLGLPLLAAATVDRSSFALGYSCPTFLQTILPIRRCSLPETKKIECLQPAATSGLMPCLTCCSGTPGAAMALAKAVTLTGLCQVVSGLIGTCPTLSRSPYLGEASPFGWPLSPNDWTFLKQEEWSERYMMCGGEMQSPMDIATSGSCVMNRGQDGMISDASDYGTVGKGTVHLSSYMRSASVKGDFGSLYLKDTGGHTVQYTAHEVHLSTDSWHTLDGQSRVAELMIFHKPKDHHDMLKDGVVVSVLFEHNESADNAIFSYMGFPQGHEELEVDEGSTWPTLTEQLNLKEAVKDATAGASYMYQGSVPVPPCSETVKYLVLGKALHVHPAQTEKLRKALACFAGGYKKRLPVANPPYNCRNVLKNSLQVDGHHHERTCKEAHESGTWYRAAACWDHGASAAHLAQCVKSPIDLDASLAATGSSDTEQLQFVMKVVNNVTDANPNSFGVRAGMPNFGSVIVSGRSFLAALCDSWDEGCCSSSLFLPYCDFLLHKLSVKPISSHSYEGKHHVAEIQIEGVMDGDGLRKLAEISGVHSGRHADTHRRLSTEAGTQAGTQEYHRLILSFPLETGADNSLLDQLGLPVAKYRDLIAHGKKYTVEHVDLQAGLQQAMSGNWFWYRGGMAVPGCPDWGVRWIVFEMLGEAVSGMDSTRLDTPQMDAATYKATVFLKNLPPLAVDKHTTCPDEEWNYDDPSCWAEKFPKCSEGQRQSPIQIHRSDIKTVGKELVKSAAFVLDQLEDNFLAACSWRPVANLHVVNFGKGLAVPGDQLGYITMVGEDGFPQFWQVAQLQLKMPSEHFIDGHAYAAELQVVHRNQQTVTQKVNSEKSFPFVTTSFFFEIGDRESTLLKQLFLPGVIPLSLDLMRHLGPALDGGAGAAGNGAEGVKNSRLQAEKSRALLKEARIACRPEIAMAEDLEEETEILEDVEEETEDVQVEEDGEGSDIGDGENSTHGETVAQDEVLDKYKVVYDQSLDRVKFPADITHEIQRTWKRFLEHAGTPEHAGELIFGAWWEAAPSIHSSFLTPKTVLHLRFVQGISPIVAALGHPSELRTQVEILCFRHLDRPVSAQAAEVLRDALLDMWEAELGADFTPKARIGWFSFLNYWGGAIVYFQREYASRIKIIHRSWREANKSVALPEEEEDVPASSEVKEDEEVQASMAEDTKKEVAKSKENEGHVAEGEGERKEKSGSQMKVPTTFREMFLFNAAVMGFGGSTWMDIILDQFDALVLNIANSYRLQERCSGVAFASPSGVLAQATIRLASFKRRTVRRSAMGAACSSAAADAAEIKTVSGNPANKMHLRLLQPQPEPPLEMPHWVPLKAVDQKAAPGGTFVDKDFPASSESIGGVTGDAANPNVGKYLQDMLKLVVPGWVRPVEMVGKHATKYKLYGVTGEPCLFKHVSPRDIQQGYLGDCWLVSSFSALAEYPDRVRSLFKQHELTEDGRYDIRLYCPHAEEWKVITIDDRIPYWQRPGAYGTPCFAKPTKENEFWPCLLEKACAKLVKAYYRLDGGFEALALEMLTGKPAFSVGISLDTSGHQPYGIITGKDQNHLAHATVYMRLQGVDGKWQYFGQDASSLCDNMTNLTDTDLWAKLQAWDKEGYSIACGSRGNYQGIIAGHAYTILRLLDDYKHGFAEVAVCFDKQNKGRRYTDQSPQAQADHQKVEMGPTGHQTWEGCNLFQLVAEECDVLILVLSKNTEPIALSDFRAVMLATLRSLAPKDWDTEHEVAWNWLWENVERILKGQLGKPKTLERALTHFIASWSEEQAMFFRKEIYKRFFALAPSGQDFFKQSSTRLYFLADRVVEMTVEMFREPRKMVQEISGLGLRHVGWGIPPELFGPYTSGAVESVRSMTTDDNTQSAFRFSLSLIAKILVRAVSEGSTLVMRAINTNQESAMKKAIAIAPRGKRAMELLNISVGTQSISPLFWSIESGSLNSARAMIVDLLTIRADRDVYYYGCDAMFTRHPDLILRLCNDASTLLWTLFDGLVWRSRLVQDGQRRVNYYIKHLVQDLEGNFSPALKWLAHHKDPRLVSHGVVMTFADLLWNRVASYQFLLGYFLFTLLVFITSQSFLVPGEEMLWRNVLTFVCRCFLYLGSMSKLLFDQCKLACSAFKTGDYQWYWIVPVPNYLHSTQQAGSALLVLLLILMYAQEPILWCISYAQTGGDKAVIFTTTCPEALDVMTTYTVFSCIAMLVYWALLMDFTLLSMRISAFVLVCGNVLADVGLFSLALVFLILMFATAISSLNHHVEGFDGVGPWLTGLLQITLGMFPPSKYEDFRSDIPVLIAVSVFVAVLSIFLVNLLVAQLNQSYRDIFEDMQGFARLNRAGVTADIIEQVSRKRWSKFLSHLRFDEPLEFNEGDVGVAGGMQVLEPANANMVTEDSIKRYGGPTAPSAPWPQEDLGENDDDRFARLEKLIVRATKKKDKGGKHHKTPSAMDASDLGESENGSDMKRGISS